MIDLLVRTKTNHWFTGFHGTLEEAKSFYIDKCRDTNGEYVCSVELLTPELCEKYAYGCNKP